MAAHPASARAGAAPTGPSSSAAPGWDPVRQYIFEEECAAAGTPRLLPFGLKMVGPVIMRFGNAAQHARFLPRILSGEDWWCQGYSEPGVGLRPGLAADPAPAGRATTTW